MRITSKNYKICKATRTPTHLQNQHEKRSTPLENGHRL